MPDQPDELTAQGVGMADHFLSGHAFMFRGGRASFLGFVQNLLVRRSDPFHASHQNREQIMQQGHKVSLHEHRLIADTPGLVALELVFKHVVGFFDRATHGLDALGSNDLLTPAGDGVQNLLKYAFNMIGSGSGQAAALATPNTAVLTANGTAGLPLVGVGTGSDAGKLQLTYIRRIPSATTSPGITYAIEFSDALASWAVNGSATEGPPVSIDATFERVTVTDSAATISKRFVRVRVTLD